MTSPRDVGLPRTRRSSPPVLGSRLTVVMAGLNLAGMLLYLRLASLAWAIPEERAAGITSLTGEPFLWAAGALPVWGAFLLGNLAWLVAGHRRRERPSVAAWAIVALGWAASVVIDFAHH